MDPQTPPSAALNVLEVAAWIKLSPESVLRAIRYGELPAVKIDRKWRITHDDVCRWRLAHGHVLTAGKQQHAKTETANSG